MVTASKSSARYSKAAGDPGRARERLEGEIARRDAPVELERLRAQPRPRGRLDRAVARPEHHLEEGRPLELVRRPPRLDQPLERQRAVGRRFPRHVRHPLQQLPKARVAPEARAQHARVLEDADERLGLGPRTARHGRAHHHVVLPRVPREQRLKRRQEDDGQG